MKKSLFTLSLCILLGAGCTRIKLEGSKKPIKVDISMRLDVYQHLQKDINTIENIVSGPDKKHKNSGGQSLLNYILPYAYAGNEIPPKIKQAALRRKERLSELSSWESRGVIGENKVGLVEIRNNGVRNNSLKRLVKAENKDRTIIYNLLAKRDNTSLLDIQKMYAERLQKDAPAGTPIEALNPNTGNYEWRIK